MAVSKDPNHGGAEFGAPLTAGEALFKRVAKFVVKNLTLSWFVRFEVVNSDRIPASGPVIVAPSHRSNIDTPLIGAAISRPTRFMAKGSIFKSVFWTKFLVALGGFPVNRGTLDREALKNALAILERDEVLVVFPEGARQEGPRIKPVFEGALWLAARGAATVVPAGIGGSARVMPIGVKLPRPRKVVVVFGEPLTLGDPNNSARVPRSELEATATELRERVQEAFDRAQILAGTANPAWDVDDPSNDERLEPWVS